jgi:hypothetical protein
MEFIPFNQKIKERFLLKSVRRICRAGRPESEDRYCLLVNANLSLCLIKLHAKKLYRILDVHTRQLMEVSGKSMAPAALSPRTPPPPPIHTG